MTTRRAMKMMSARLQQVESRYRLSCRQRLLKVGPPIFLFRYVIL